MSSSASGSRGLWRPLTGRPSRRPATRRPTRRGRRRSSGPFPTRSIPAWRAKLSRRTPRAPLSSSAAASPSTHSSSPSWPLSAFSFCTSGGSSLGASSGGQRGSNWRPPPSSCASGSSTSSSLRCRFTTLNGSQTSAPQAAARTPSAPLLVGASLATVCFPGARVVPTALRPSPLPLALELLRVAWLLGGCRGERGCVFFREGRQRAAGGVLVVG
mmetsp:Transcript_31012/g.72497  ORF Transcript_31012/g.72497 Transcript_31012/m.72497 type:complete len:215 (+) Transcript_31012:2350-2994(+)